METSARYGCVQIAVVRITAPPPNEGAMLVVRTVPRAFAVALLPLAFLHAAVLIMALVGALPLGPMPGFGAPAAEPAFLGLPAPDRVLVAFAVRLGLEALTFVILHLRARRLGLRGRGAYALLGAAAALVGYALAGTSGEIGLVTLPAGAVMTAGILPGLVGLITGLVYWQVAGLEPVAGPAAAATEHPAATPRYDGPIQVRTSFAAMGIAATIPALAVFVLALPILMLAAPIIGTADDSDLGKHMLLAVAMPVQMMLGALIVSAIPAALFALAVHGLARALKRTAALGYGGCGAVGGLAVAILLAPFNPLSALGFLVIPMVLVGAAVGGTYRRFAGVEPLPLPEPVLVRDIEAVVPENHPDRSTRQIVLE